MARKKKEQLFVDYYEEWIEVYKAGAIADVTLRKYYTTCEYLRKICPKLLISDLNRKTYQGILNEYGKTHERQTAIDFHHQVKSCIKDMFHDGDIEVDPTYKVVVKGLPPKPKKQKFLQTDELKKLLQSLDLSHGVNRDWMILIAAKTGLRFAELLAITPNDFDFVKNTLTIDKSWEYRGTKGHFKSTKTSSSCRTISIDWQIVGQFKPVIDELPPDDPIFIPKDDEGRFKRVFNSTYNNYLAQKCKDLDITVVSLHALRHTHASVLLAAGVSIHTISARLGHADVGITQETYAHVLDELKTKDDQKMMSVLMQIT